MEMERQSGFNVLDLTFFVRISPKKNIDPLRGFCLRNCFCVCFFVFISSDNCVLNVCTDNDCNRLNCVLIGCEFSCAPFCTHTICHFNTLFSFLVVLNSIESLNHTMDTCKQCYFPNATHSS